MKRNSLLVAIAISSSLIMAQPAISQTTSQSEIEHLHDALNLAPNQELPWLTYKRSLNSISDVEQRRQSASAMFPHINALQRMQLAKAELQHELDDMQTQYQALSAFYNALSPEQQRVFDAQTLPPRQDR